MDPDPPEGLDGASGGAFHRNEAISAVQDEDQFYGEDDDYDDLYNDVNVGDGFLHSVPRSGGGSGSGAGAGGFPGEEPASRPHAAPAPAPPTPPEKVQVQIPGIAGDPKIERPSADRSVEFSNQGLRAGVAAEAAPPPPLRPPVPPPSAPAVARPEIHGGQSGNNSGFGPAVGGGGGANVNGGGGGSDGGGGRGGTTTLFVGELHWWTTDADLEAEVSKYGPVKEVRFFDEKASGKSKGYCQVDFFDSAAATACKEGMNGHPFYGRPCVVAYASPFTVRKMGEAQVKNHHTAIGTAVAQSPAQAPKGRAPPVAGNFGRGGNPGAAAAAAAGGGGGGGNWGRGAMGNRGPMGNMRNRFGPMGGRGIMGNGGMVAPPQPPLLHPGAMMGPGFGYGGGFHAGPASAPFPGLMPSFPPVVAPHVNPAFFGRGGMAAAVAGVGGGGVGMWPDQSMGGGWGGEEQSSYGDDAASDQQYGEGSYGKDRRHEREKDVMEDRPERKYRDDREIGRERERERERERDRERDRERERERERERDRYRDERDRHGDHYRHRERESERDDDWDRGRSSIARSKSREVEHSKRRRLSPE